MTTILSADDRTVIDHDTGCRCTIIGVLDSERARQLTEQLLSGIRTLQGGLEEAERLLGHTVTREAGATIS